MNVLVVFGTRPELIKLAPVIRAMRADPETFDLRVCTTGQHRDLLHPLLDLFQIRPDVDLDLMRPRQTPADIVGGVVAGLTPELRPAPDWVVVQGDTTTTMAAAIAARYAGVRIAHVEAGLRTGHLHQPFPEEINRRVVGAIADLHFAPTAGAREHLLQEGVPDASIVVTGNTAIDALQWALSRPEPHEVEHLLWEAPRDVILVTAHRRESFGDPLEEICLALRDLTDDYGEAIRVVFPVHPNPNVMAPVYRMLGRQPSIVLTRPLDYLTFVHILKRSRFVLTDSGGVQEEAPSLGKPVLVMREGTERPEGIEAGAAVLVGTNRARIVAGARMLLEDDEAYARMAQPVSPHGDGRAAERIVAALKSAMKRTRAPILATLVLALAMVSFAACGGPKSAPPVVTPPSTPLPKPDDASMLKIDSQLRAEINRLQGKPAPPGATDVKIDAEKRAFVDVRAEVSTDLIANVVTAGGIVVSSSARDYSVLAWVPLLKLDQVAAVSAVRAIVPAAQSMTQTSPALGQEFELRVGGAVTVVDARLTVTLERVSDSRCPANVQCVSAGDAVLRLIVIGADGAQSFVELHTAGVGKQDAKTAGHRVHLVRLLPDPPQSAVLPQDRYVATVAVSK